MNLVSVAQSYNKAKVRLFSDKTALKRYLDPVGLFSHPPTKDYGNNTTPISPKEENKYFEASHFARYRLEKALDEEKNVQFWTDIYLAIRNRKV